MDSKTDINELMIMVKNAVISLHKRDVVHNDLDISNILYHNGEIKIIDYGKAQFIGCHEIKDFTPDVDKINGYIKQYCGDRVNPIKNTIKRRNFDCTIFIQHNMIQNYNISKIDFNKLLKHNTNINSISDTSKSENDTLFIMLLSVMINHSEILEDYTECYKKKDILITNEFLHVCSKLYNINLEL